jgi:hypothetical protein
MVLNGIREIELLPAQIAKNIVEKGLSSDFNRYLLLLCDYYVSTNPLNAYFKQSTSPSDPVSLGFGFFLCFMKL